VKANGGRKTNTLSKNKIQVAEIAKNQLRYNSKKTIER